jgi:hypothetical protein
MDTFIKHSFPDIQGPGAAFVFDDKPFTFTYIDADLKVMERMRTQNRLFTMSQPMTPLGLGEVINYSGINLVDGVNQLFLETDGVINAHALGLHVKQFSGLPPTATGNVFSALSAWNWCENQTTLLFNMLRFSFLRKIVECNGNLNGGMGLYEDGHVRIDMDQYFLDQAGYNRRCKGDEWPAEHIADEDRVKFHLLYDFIPAMPYDAIDLVGLDKEEAVIVLMMLLPWKRKSRMRVDFDTDRLTSHIYYRYSEPITEIDSWMAGRSHAPTMPNSAKVWGALVKYVERNRLFGAFSTALYVFATMAYQFVPVTAEGIVWLQYPMQVSLPKFKAYRGRLKVLNEGIPALITHRSDSEWKYINARFERVNLISLAWAQAFQTGIAVRSVRRGLEPNPTDLRVSDGDFHRPDYFVANAVAEAMMFEIHTSGQDDVYVIMDVRPDKYETDRLVCTDMPWAEGLQVPGYAIDKYLAKPKAEEWTTLPVRLLNVGNDPDNTLRHMYNVNLAGARAKIEAARQISPKQDAFLTAAERLAVKGCVRYRLPVQDDMEYVGICAPWLVFAGAPTLILPLKCFPYPTPFEFSGDIHEGLGTALTRSFKVSPTNAWLVANLARLCGYDLDVATTGHVAMGTRYFSPNDVNLVWPMLMEMEESPNVSVYLEGQRKRARHFIVLPPLTDKMINNNRILYRIDASKRGTAKSHVRDKQGIIEVLADDDPPRTEYIVGFRTDKRVQRLQAWVTRQTQGFHYALFAEDGETSGQSQTPDAEGADALSLRRGISAAAVRKAMDSLFSTP